MDQEGNRGQLDQPLSDPPDETARIREHIEHTRADLSGTIEELQDRLRPEHLVSRAGDAVRGAVEQKVKTMVNTASSTAARVADQARSSAETLSTQAQSHPLPTALAIGGLAWWLTRRRREFDDYDGGTALGVLPALAAGACGYYLLSQRMRNGDSLVNRFKDRGYGTGSAAIGAEEYGEYELRDELGPDSGSSLGERVRHLGETADEYRHRAQAAVGAYASQATEQARHFRDVARTRVEDTRTMLMERSEELGETFNRWMRENPLAVGATAFALGAIAGLSLPVTETEQRTLGVARDSLVQQAGRAVETALSK